MYNVNLTAQPDGPCSTATISFTDMGHVSFHQKDIYTAQVFSLSLHHHLLFIAIPLSATRFMKTRQKNGSTHPGKPDMTLSQLRSAGLSRTTNVRNPPTTSKKLSTTSKKPTKDQQIVALENKLRAICKLISSICHDPPHPVYHWGQGVMY